MASTPNKTRITATISPRLVCKIITTAKRLDMLRSAFIEAVLEAYLDEAELQAKLLGDRKVMNAFAQAMSAPGVMSAMAKAMGDEISDDQQMQLRNLLEGLGQTQNPTPRGT